MKYLVTLSPLEPFLFGGDNTFGKLGVKYRDWERTLGKSK